MSLYEYLSSEGRFHGNTEENRSYPLKYINWKFIPPTFVTYNVNLVETYDVKEIEDYVSKLFDNKTSDFKNELIELALQKMKDNLKISVEEAVDLAFSELSVIYGGSAFDVIDNNEEEEP